MGNAPKMEKPACLFGPFFQRQRLKKGMSFWDFVYRVAYYPANIKRIEEGKLQPGIGLAFRLLDAMGMEVGAFMAALAREHRAVLPQSLSSLGEVPVSYTLPALEEGQKSLFGPLLAQARRAGSVSQTAMAKAAHYGLRNMNVVEKGAQEPGIMTALALVMTTGVDVEEFFNVLHACWREHQGTPAVSI